HVPGHIAQLDVPPARKCFDHHEAEVVTRLRIFRTGIAEASDNPHAAVQDAGFGASGLAAASGVAGAAGAPSTASGSATTLTSSTTGGSTVTSASSVSYGISTPCGGLRSEMCTAS